MTAPVAATSMLIRRPVAEVFRAIADPTQTTRFWFTDSTGPLASGARVTWTWAMYGVSTEVEVQVFKPERRVLMTWDNPSDPTEVEWRFESRGDHTLLSVENRGFSGAPDEQAAKALDSTGGFALVLAGAKIWLEHGIEPGFVVDRHPDARVKGWKA
ncbi:MAG: SRPBCC family protein [Brevundimonas sp.]|nr:SRPBCC family protein [Brevundimonas sp.]